MTRDAESGFSGYEPAAANQLNTITERVAVVIPILNERDSIAEVISDLKRFDFVKEILVVDGGSTDGSEDFVSSLGASVWKQNGKGKGQAVREAFSLASVIGDIVVMMDGDRSMSTDEIPSLVEAVKHGADIAKGSRFLPGGGSSDISPLRKFGAKTFVHMLNLLFGTNHTDLCYGFNAFRSSALRRLNVVTDADGFDIEAEIVIKATRMGMKISELPSFESRRWSGESRLHTFRDGYKILKRILSEFYSENFRREHLTAFKSAPENEFVCEGCGHSPAIEDDIFCEPCHHSFAMLSTLLDQHPHLAKGNIPNLSGLIGLSVK